MSLPIDKAKKVLQVYKKNNYNAYQTLLEAGYKETVAQKQSKRVINNAIKTVATQEMKDLVQSSNPMSKLLEFAKLSEDELANEYLSLIKQNKDLSTKLKAMIPLLAEQGIKWNEEQVKISTPVLNITMEDKETVQTTDVIDMTQESVEGDIGGEGMSGIKKNE